MVVIGLLERQEGVDFEERYRKGEKQYDRLLEHYTRIDGVLGSLVHHPPYRLTDGPHEEYIEDEE